MGVKDATGDVAGRRRVVAEAPDGFDVYCGDDSLTLPFASIGGAGDHQRGRPLGRPAVRRDDRQLPGRRRGAGRRRQPAPAESYRFESTDEYPNPVPAKAACRALGLAVGQCRLPNAPAPAALDDQARCGHRQAGAC